MQDKVVTEGYRLSPQQTRVWILQQADGSQVYKAQSAALIEGEIDEEALKAAISEVVDRHEILRTNFYLLPGMALPLQVIMPDQVVEFREVDLSIYDAHEKDARFEEFLREETLHRFDLRQEPAARFSLFRLSEAKRILVTSLPSVCADSRSLKNLFREIARSYDTRLRGETFSDQPIQYVDFSEWQRERLEQENGANERWGMQSPDFSSALQFIPGFESRTDTFPGGEPDYVPFVLSASTVSKIDRISATHDVSSDVFLLACWQMLIWRLTGCKDVTVDSLREGRRMVELRDALGTFASFCPARLRLEPDHQFTELLEMVDQAIRSADERLEHILREDSAITGNGRLADRANAIGFEYEEWPGVEFAGQAKFSYWKQSCRIDSFKLKLGAYRKSNELTIEIQYDSALFSREGVELIRERYLRLIESAVEHKHALIGDYEKSGDDLEKASGYRRIRDEVRGVRGNDEPPLVRVSREEKLPLSFAQQRLWFLAQLAPNNPFYNIPGMVRFEGRLSLEALERAINEVVRRHEVLRTRFEAEAGAPVQVIDQWEPRRLEVEDLTGLAPEERELEVVRRAGEEAETGFDLSREPLLRVKVMKLGEDDHVLLYTMSHIVSDGWSMGILIREVGTLYQAYSAGAESPLEELPIQYADFAVWQRNWLRGEVLEKKLDYWRKQLAGLEELELPTDHPRPAAQSYRGAALPFVVEGGLAEALRELSRRESVSLFMTLLGGFYVLMSRYSGQSDVAVGTDIANRNRAEIEGLIGFFVNQLVLRVEVRGGESFGELLRKVREACLGAYANQDVPFEKLVEELQPERDLSRSPLFQVKLVLQNAPGEALQLGEVSVSGAGGADAQTAKFDLTMVIADTGGDLAGMVEYSLDLFEAETVERLIGHYLNALRGIVEDSGRRIGELSLLGPGEREQVVVEWNQTARPYPRDRSIHQVFAGQAEQSPDRIALIGAEDQLSYGELERRANQLGRYLQRLGVGPEVAVGLCLERSVEMVVALLGTLKAGGAYLPLDPEYPLERLSFMLEDAGVGVVVTRRELEERLPAFWGQTVSPDFVFMDDEWERIAEESESEPETEVEAGNLAYLIYTSGSTGRPKGAAIPHRAVLRLALNANYAQLDRNSSVLQLAPQTFDAATFEVWGALLNGGRLVVAETMAPGAVELGRIINKHGVETMWLTASLYNAIVDEGAEELSGLQQLLIGGEALSVRHVRAGLERLQGTKLINGYGPTEGTTFTCCHEIGAEDVARRNGRVPIGRPIANTKVYVMDEWMQLSPVGVDGELYIGGDGLARCYYDRAEMTAEKFIPDTYSDVGGERLYRTGDWVRYLSDGKIEFVGRADDQVKVRGYRIELGEIEAALNEHATVRRSVVVVSAHEGEDKRLLGYVVGEEGASAPALKKYVRERLPEYMVPDVIVLLEEVPVTANGKIDRKKLQEAPLNEAERQVEEAYVAPITPVEEILIGIYEEVLKLDRVGARDNFFEAGGHSLLATQVISRVRNTYGVEIGLGSIFEEPTVKGLARRVEEAMGSREKAEAPPLVRASREEKLPLSFAQQRLWFLDQLAPNNPFYNIPGMVRFEGRLSLEALERAINEVVRRHEVLRTRFEAEAGAPVQVIDQWEPRRLEVEDLTGLAPEERELEVVRRAGEEAETGFDLSREPLLRVKVMKLGEDDHVLLYTMSHIVSDGWSMGILIREVGTLYQAYSAGAESPLEELPIQYADFAVWQRNWLRGEVLEKKLDYWRKQLAGLEELELPTDHPRPAAQSYRGAALPFVVEGGLAEALRELSRRESVSLFMTLLGGFYVLMSRYSGQSDVAVGTDIANRNRAEIEGLIGFFVNQLVLRVEVRGGESFGELLRKVREACLGAYANQDVPFEKLVEELQPERDLSRSPLFQVKLVLQNAPGEALQLGEVSVSGAGGADAQTAKFDLTMVIADTGGDLAGMVEYSLDLFEAETVERLIGHYLNALRGIVEDSGRRIGELSLLGPGEREQVVVEWNQTARPYPRDRSIHQVFAGQAEQSPDRIALIGAEDQLSYGELERRANQLGRYLQRLGVGPEVAVGLCLERSVEMVVALLGTLKAGGAYLPLDPEYPLERLSFMLEDAGVGVVVTRRELEERLPAFWGQTVSPDFVFMDDEWERIAEESESEPETEVEAGNLAYLIYTSGSTGRPKGVMVAHNGLCNLAEAQKEAFGLCGSETQSRVLQFASFSFDASVSEVFSTLAAGGSLVVYGRERMMPGEDLKRVLREEQITAVTLPPTALGVTEEAGLDELQTVIAAGEACPPEVVERWGKGRRFLNAYGPTEASVCASIGKIEAGGDRRPTIGTPIANTQIYILDGEMNPAPAGVRGDLYISGVGVARGYSGRPGLTAERFLPNVFSDEGGERLYWTGDVCRYRPDGKIEFVGRADDQVKVRGYRIELGEVETVLNEQPGVKQSAVVASEDERGGKRLLGYVVGEVGVTAAELKRRLRERAPEFMIPDAIILLDEMPITANGKIDRKRLPQLKEAGREAGGEYVGARTPVEEMLLGIFGELLKLDRVGARDNFFDIGGHSLLATQVVSRVRDVFGVVIEVRNIFEDATAEALAGRIEAGIRSGERPKSGEESPSLVRAPRSGQGGERLPLSFAQQRLWFMDQLEPGNAAYNLPGVVKLEGKLDIEALERAVNEIIRRHEALRTRIEVEEGQPAQVIDAWAPRKLELRDLTSLAPEERAEEVGKVMTEETGTGFDLSRGPLLRIKVLKLEEEEHVLFYTMHHIVSDGWSMGVLVRELCELYEAIIEGRESPLPELPIQYADFAVWQRAYLTGEALEDDVRYWKEQLRGAAAMELPADHMRPERLSYRGGMEWVEIDQESSDGLRRLGQREGATLFMALVAAFKALLMRYSGEEDVSVGTVIANRTRKEMEGLIGFFVNTLVLRTDLGGNPSFRELIKREREVALGAYARQDVPFEKLVEEINPERDLSRNSLFQVMVVLQNVSREAVEIRGLKFKEVVVEKVEEETGTAKFDLTVVLAESEGGITGSLEYSRDLFEGETIRRMARHFERMVAEVVRGAERRIRSLSLMSEREREQILFRWNQSAEAYPRDRSIHELFEEQAKRRPEAVAVVFQDQALTYRELNARANRLAVALARRGVGSEVLVALLAERGLDFLTTILAVFKAGGAYLPLDPQHPAKRIGQTLGRSRTATVISASQFGSLVAEAVDGLTAETRPALYLLEEVFKEPGHEENLRSPFLPGQMAYVIFTSGSTGTPKGAVVEHRGMLNHLFAKIRDLRLNDQDVVAQTASQCFDISVWQFLAALLVGGQVRIFDDQITHDPASLLDQVDLQKVTILEIVPSMMRAMLAEADQRRVKPELSTLRWLIPTGEALPPELCHHWFRLYPEAPILNAYGPTECSDDVTHCTVGEVLSDRSARAPIGRPIANTQIYVMDGELQPQPIGVIGELCIGGEGVGRGYLNEAGKTSECFVPAPFAAEAGARLYRSGDLARYLPDGNLEYRGRIDHQVKIRGFRIELGEIEAALNEHGAVEQAVVVAREDQQGEKRLVAYIVKTGSQEASYEEELNSSRRAISDWQNVFEEVYANQVLPTDEALINPRVWMSSYTDQPWPEEEILACVEDTVARILSLQPRRVLEIGCGTGLVLSRVAPHCEVYYGTDISAAALRQLSAQLTRRGLEGKVKLLQRAGDNLNGFPQQHFDLVVINEVAQFFPSVQYLLRILEQIPELVAPESAIFLGGLRNLELLDVFRASVEMSRAAGSISLKQLRQRINKNIRREKELLIAPDFFPRLKKEWPWIEEVEIQLKGREYANEVVKYRYDATLYVGWAWREKTVRRCLDWEAEGLSLDGLRKLLAESGETLEVQGIPNSRLRADRKILELLAEESDEEIIEQLREKVRNDGDSCDVIPQQMWELGREMGCRTLLSWPSSGALGAYKAIFQRQVEKRRAERQGISPGAVDLSRNWIRWDRYANKPLQEVAGMEQVAQWREFLADRLPEYMAPAVFVELESMPLTPNGKLDRRALPAPDAAGLGPAGGYVAPRTLVEARLAEIWSQVLGVNQIGVNSDFFELGGHSLLATQVISRVRAILQVELPLQTLFERPTISELAQRVEQAYKVDGGTPLAPLVRASRERQSGAQSVLRMPLSFAQQRLWFIDQLEPGGATYNIPGAVRLEGMLDLDVLESVINEIIRRHEVLRTRIEVEEGRPAQAIDEWEPRRLEVEDLTGLPGQEREEEVRKIAKEEARTGFDLGRGPLLRVKILKLGEDEHALLYTMHHIISDGWSMGILVRELRELYAAMSEGKGSPLPELPIQYADYAVWQREYLAGGALETDVRYWKEQLRDAAVMELPSDRPRPAAPSYRGGLAGVEIGEELTDGLRKLSQQEGATLFMALMAAFKVLLMRYGGEEDVSVGTVIANRTRKEVEGLIGFFANTLVMRTDLGGNPSFRELIRREREVALGAYAHQDAPFEKVVEEVNPERDLSRSPLFQVMMALQNISRETSEIKGLKLTEIGEDPGVAEFDLSLMLSEGAEGVAGHLQYSRDLYDGATVARMARHFEQVVADVVGDAERRVGEIELMSEAEKRQIVVEWNGAAAPYGERLSVHEMIAQQAERRPEAVAVVCETEQVSYGVLNERANRLARFLRRAGIGAERRVGICLERGFGMVESALGVMKAGGVYVPMDPAYPAERLNFMAEESGCEVVISGAGLKSEFERAGCRVVAPETDGEGIQQESVEGFESGVDSANLAYVIYTSGSTGKPKGVMISHGNLSNRVLWEKAAHPPGESDALLQLASFSFDVSVWEMFTPLASGARLILPGPGEHQNPERIARLIQEHEVTIVGFVPSMLELLLDEPVETRFASLRRVLSGAEALPLRTMRRFLLRCDAELYNFYGPTESTIDATFWKCAPEEGRTTVPIGRPVGALQVYALDSRMNPVPIGVPGQLYIGGAGLARGYQERPDLTAEMFIPNPFNREYGTRLYRTGDLARYRADGNIESLGRMDQQVKIRGVRIELEEIESALKLHPAVREAVVLIEEQGGEEHGLLAWPENPGKTESSQVDWLDGEFPDGLPADYREIRKLIERIDSLSEEEVGLALLGAES
jgi:amino acid adenylation domain-containing protein